MLVVTRGTTRWTRCSLSFVALISVTVFFLPKAQALTEPALHRADFVFKGKVTAIGASNAEQWRAGPKLVVVRVEKVLPYGGYESLAQQQGQEVTLQVNDPATLAVGQEYFFATTVAGYDAHLALLDIEHQPAPPEDQRIVLDGKVLSIEDSARVGTAAMRTRALFLVYKAYKGQQSDDALVNKQLKIEVIGQALKAGQTITISTTTLDYRLTHATIAPTVQNLAVYTQLAGASLSEEQGVLNEAAQRSTAVVGGTVVGVAATPLLPEPSWESPLLRSAEINVTRSYKGSLAPGSRVWVWFVDAGDNRWVGAPKLTSGEQAILFLRHPSELLIHVPDDSQLGVFQGDDVRPPQDAAQVETAIVETEGGAK